MPPQNVQGEKPKMNPCIYGKQFHKDCPVRKELQQAKPLEPLLSKNIVEQSGLPAGLTNLVTQFGNVLNHGDLSKYCEHCPYIKGMIK